MKNIIGKWKGLLVCICMLLSIVSFTAVAAELDNDVNDNVSEGYEIVLTGSEYAYTGMEIKPRVLVAQVDANGAVNEDTVLNAETDYSVTYTNNIEVGIATVEVQGIGKYESVIELEKEFKIIQASIEDAEIDLSYTTYPYTGKEKRPVITVSLGDTVVSKSNYDVTYVDNVEVGTAHVIIEGKNNLTGTVDIPFKITLKKPTFSLGRSYNRIRIYWDEVTGADGYQIYRSTSSDSGFSRVATVSADDTNPYADKGLSHNQKYYYKIRAYKEIDGKKVYSSYSKVRSITTRVNTPTIQRILKTNYKTLTIEWNCMDGATGYSIYRSTSPDEGFERIANVSGMKTLSYKDTGLVCGRTYYYKVRAYRTVDGTKYYGSYSAVKNSCTRPTKVTITDDTFYNGTEITLYWKKADGAEGYEIYRSTTKDGEYTKVKTISSATTLEWTDTDLSKTSDYYYKVRAICRTDGTKVNGLFSDVYRRRKAGWVYTTSDGNKVKIYYNAKGKKVTDVSNLIGKQDSYVIKVNKQRCTVTVYAKDGDNGYIIPVKAFICSPGQTTPTGTFYTPIKYRWHELMGPCWGQWCTRIVGGILFHSVFYNSENDNDTLSVSAYNKLGTICSHGCVRLTAGDAKWIYDNCELETKVIIYNSDVSGPFGKPSAVKLPSWHTWDPTDPNKFDKCDARGCH